MRSQKKFHFTTVFRSHEHEKPAGVFKFLRFEKRFRGGVVWTVGRIVDTFTFSPSKFDCLESGLFSVDEIYTSN